MSYEEFASALEEIKEFFHKLDRIYDATEHCLSIWEMTDGGCANLAIQLLSTIMQDTNNLIAEWIYELNWGQRNCIGADDRLTGVKTMRDLYELLVEES